MPLTFRQGLSRRWMWSAAISLGVCALWFGYLVMVDRCWLSLPGFLIVLFAWLWLLLFFVIRTPARVLLGIVSLLAMFWWANVTRSPTPAKESRAVGRLRQLRQAMADYKSQHQSYPENLAGISSPSSIEGYYTFDLVP